MKILPLDWLNGPGPGSSPLGHPFDRCPVLGRWVIAPALVLVLVWLLFAREWSGIAAFVGAIDHNDLLLQDFLYYYYNMAAQMPDADTPVIGYLYSAFFAVVIAPLGKLAPADALWAWGLVQVILFLALLYVPFIHLLKRSSFTIILYTGVLATSFPVLHNTTWGQVSVLVTLCVVLSFHAYVSNWRGLAGAMLALAITIKYYPAVFVAYFILKRDWRFLAGLAVGLFLFYFAIPAWIMGPKSWLTFELATIDSRAKLDNWVIGDVNSQYFAHVARRWTEALFNTSGDTIAAISRWLGYGVVLVSLNLLRLMRGSAMQGRDIIAMVILFLSLPFLVKTTWPHYMTWLPLCQLILLVQGVSRTDLARVARVLIAGLALISIGCSSFFGFALFPSWELYTGYGALFLANALLLIAVYLLVFSTLAEAEPEKATPLPEQAAE